MLDYALDYATLRLLWWLIIGVLLIGFAVTDGFDMGVGMLLCIIGKTGNQRRVLINTIAPHWDGNQVWLILAGGALFAIWPLVYAAAFSGFYVAMILVVVSLYFRPLGFDYRQKILNSHWQASWDLLITLGSAVPALLFGVAFGNLLQGVPFQLDSSLRPYYQGGLIGLLNPFGLLCGVLSLCMLLMQGSAWLQMKSGGVVQQRARRISLLMACVVPICFGMGGICVSRWIEGYQITSVIDTLAESNPVNKSVLRQLGAWLDNFSHYPWLQAIPAGGLLLPLVTWITTKKNRGGITFLCSSCGIACIILTAGIAMFPFVMPSSLIPAHSLTLWDASSSHKTLSLTLWIVAIFLPIVLAYTFWCYRRLWGRLDETAIENNPHTFY